MSGAGGLGIASLRAERTDMRQRRSVSADICLWTIVLSLVASCSDLSPLSRENGQTGVIDELNFEVPKDKPITRKDDPLENTQAQADEGLNAPIIVAGQASSGRCTPYSADEGEAIYRVNFDNADLREAVGSILGTTLGLEYLIDPRVMAPLP